MIKDITVNKKAYHDYEILEKYEAGIVLSGMEIKAIRAGRVNLKGSHARVMHMSKDTSHMAKKKGNKQFAISDKQKPEVFLINMHISAKDSDPTKTRKLLMHRQEINRLIGKTQEKRLTLIPLRLYLKRGRAKIELGLGRGKKLYDKREDIKKRDLDRESAGKIKY